MKKEGWLIFLLSITLMLIVLHFAVPDEIFWGRFNLDNEIGMGAWFTQMLLFSAGALAFVNAQVEHKKHSHLTFGWFFSGLVLIYLSLDEGTAIHEMTAGPIRDFFDITSGPLIFAWIIPALVIVVCVGIALAKFAFKLPAKIRLILILAAVVYLGGAAGFEVLSGTYWSENNFVFDETYRAYNALEEGFEMTGVIIAIFGILSYSERVPSRSTTKKKIAAG